MNKEISEALNFGIDPAVLANMDYNKEENNDNPSMSSRLFICLNCDNEEEDDKLPGIPIPTITLIHR